MTPERKTELRDLINRRALEGRNLDIAVIDILDALDQRDKQISTLSTEVARLQTFVCYCCIEYECDCMEGITW